MQLTRDQLDNVRQWFNSVEDTNPDYLHLGDYILYIEIMNHLGMPVSKRTEQASLKFIEPKDKQKIEE